SAIGSNFGSMFVNLRDYATRRELESTMSPEDRQKYVGATGDLMAAYLRKEFDAQVHDANIQVFGPPPVRGVGRAGGFAFVLEDRGDLGFHELQTQTDNLVRNGNQDPDLVGLFSVFRANVPQFHIEPDLGACMLRGVKP